MLTTTDEPTTENINCKQLNATLPQHTYNEPLKKPTPKIKSSTGDKSRHSKNPLWTSVEFNEHDTSDTESSESSGVEMDGDCYKKLHEFFIQRLLHENETLAPDSGHEATHVDANGNETVGLPSEGGLEDTPIVKLRSTISTEGNDKIEKENFSTLESKISHAPKKLQRNAVEPIAPIAAGINNIELNESQIQTFPSRNLDPKEDEAHLEETRMATKLPERKESSRQKFSINKRLKNRVRIRIKKTKKMDAQHGKAAPDCFQPLFRLSNSSAEDKTDSLRNVESSQMENGLVDMHHPLVEPSTPPPPPRNQFASDQTSLKTSAKSNPYEDQQDQNNKTHGFVSVKSFHSSSNKRSFVKGIHRRTNSAPLPSLSLPHELQSSLIEYLSPSVRLYKDRTPTNQAHRTYYNFDPIKDGASMSITTGKIAALEKLRQKTQLLHLEHDEDSHKKQHTPFKTMSSSPSVEHDVKHIVSIPLYGDVAGNVMETRSLLKIKMGFFHISYGVLLQWNGNSKIDKICMKKSATNLFLKPPPQIQKISQKPVRRTPPSKARPLRIPGLFLSPVDRNVSARKLLSSMDSVLGISLGSCVGAINPCSPTASPSASPVKFLRKRCSTPSPALQIDWYHFDHDKDLCTVISRNLLSQAATEVYFLSPPYLIPKPDPRTSLKPVLEIRILGARFQRCCDKNNKKMDIKAQYLRISLGNSHHSTRVVDTLSSSAKDSTTDAFSRGCTQKLDDDLFCQWKNQDDNFCVLSHPKINDVLRLELIDATKGKEHLHLILGKVYIPIKEIEPTKDEGVFTKFSLEMNDSDVNGIIFFEMLYRDNEKWWVREELGARNLAANDVDRDAEKGNMLEIEHANFIDVDAEENFKWLDYWISEICHTQ